MNRLVIGPQDYEAHVPVLIIGAGAAGLTAALVARSRGRDVLVLERDSLPRGSTALSAGLIPAGGTRWQKADGISDSPALLASDIMAKADYEPDPALVDTITRHVGQALEWLADKHGLPFSVISNFNYPGHSAFRMHGLPSRSGSELMDRLRQAAEEAGIDILCNAPVTTLYADKTNRVHGVLVSRPDGSSEMIGCDTVVLACNGYGGNKALVSEHIPELKDALYFGHPGNQGDALLWGEALGAKAHHLSGHQGHGSVATPHGILITWATIMEGGFQVNLHGERFSDESHGYSEQAANVLAQPDGRAFSVFDGRIAAIARQFEDFRQAEAGGAVISAETVEELASKLGLPATKLAETMETVSQLKQGMGRTVSAVTSSGLPRFRPPFTP